MKTTLIALSLALITTGAIAAPLRIVALGDSLTAGYGLQPGEDYPSQLQAALIKEGYDVTINNAGVSGDTTAGGASRVDWAVAGQPKPTLVIVALGANDMLRGLPPAETEKNLRKILQSLKDKKIPAVLFGMKAGFQLPLMFRNSFNAIYEDLSDEFDVPLYPFFLEGVAMDAALNLGDGVHPNNKGVAIMVEKTLETVQDALDDAIED